jgi:alpha-amylase/alpha-mannosidase (GH57 family)
MAKTNKYICIHGHFYQPPRENAWLETIEMQESAAPYHDWNDRITEECYGPNCVSRILNGSESIVDIVNNFSKISYNFGPTLLSWMERFHPVTYSRIIASDALSMQEFNGHGSAMAQVYNHIIMPLANRRDKETQIKWGLYDFEMRFGRKAEGMWLAETAVDLETLEIMADNGIRFTVLAPHQAKRFKIIGDGKWTEGIDTRRPYICRLNEDKKIILFFYHGELAQKVAFGGLLKSGKTFAQELINAFDPTDIEPQLVHIATDGETFGHHHRHGDMALAYCLDNIKRGNYARITNYSEYISLFPPEYEVEIHENTSWSCSHGVGRWKEDCGCKTGGLPHWNQKWRKPLRDALDHLNKRFETIYTSQLSKYHVDPWQLRNEYIRLFLNRNKENTLAFIHEKVPVELSRSEVIQIIRLLEMQRQAMLMFTSCGWFFNDIAGIETIQILQYAKRGIQLAEMATEKILDDWFSVQLKSAISNDPEEIDGYHIYQKHIIPRLLTLTQVGMHYAAHLLFSDKDDFEVLNYDCQGERIQKLRAGSYTLVMGRVEVHSRVTLINKQLSFAILHLGNHHLMGNSATDMELETFESLARQISEAFHEGNLMNVLEAMQTHFRSKSLTFHDLIKDEQLKLLDAAIHNNIRMVIQEYEDINTRLYGLMNQMRKSHLSVPLFFLKNLSALVSLKLEEHFATHNPADISMNELMSLGEEVKKWNLEIDSDRIVFEATRSLNAWALSLQESEVDRLNLLTRLYDLLNLMDDLHLKPHRHEVQNAVFKLLKSDNNKDVNERSILDKLAVTLNLEPR